MPRLRQPTARKQELFEIPPEKPVDDESLKAAEESATPEPFEQPEDEAPAVKVEEPEKDDAALALRKQIEELKKSEELQRGIAERMTREREAAIRMAAEQAKKLGKSKRQGLEQEELAIKSTFAAAKAESEKALTDYKNALDLGDNSAAAEAMDRLTDAKANLRILERGQEELKEKRKELKKERRRLEEQAAQPESQPQSTGDVIDTYPLPDAEKDWLRGHRDYITNPEKAADLRYANERAILKGYKAGDPGYLPEIEKNLATINGFSRAEEPVQQRRTPPVSAPVSREVPSGGGRKQPNQANLTVEEREAARISGVTETEYARQKMKLSELKASGDERYGGQR